jgi:hypothetical protein
MKSSSRFKPNIDLIVFFWCFPRWKSETYIGAVVLWLYGEYCISKICQSIYEEVKRVRIRVMATFNNISAISWRSVFVCIYMCISVQRQFSSFYNELPIKLVTMFYAIPDTLLKVSLNTKKTGHHVLRYT